MFDEKTCVICGIDVSKKRRVKDKTGRYACMECATREGIDVQQGIHPGSRAASGHSTAAGIDYFATMHQDFCPQCGTLLGKDSTICVACKFNTAPQSEQGPGGMGADTLGPIARRITEEVSNFIPGFYFGPRNQFIAWCTLFVGMWAIGSSNLHTMYLYIAAWALFLLMTYIITIGVTLNDKKPIWAAVGIFGLAFVPLSVVMPIYGFWKSGRTWLKVLWVVAILALFGGTSLYFSMHSHEWEIVQAKLAELPGLKSVMK
ncbi:MAG: hypothetical protein KF805_01945 [Phycisphaeraceae bacterium]|nr:hypothetical protein [Phycisphaeraceae bacterium]